jgi:hypothetical protein
MASDFFVIVLMIDSLSSFGPPVCCVAPKTPHPKNAGHLNLFPISPPIAAARLQTAASDAPRKEIHTELTAPRRNDTNVGALDEQIFI